MTRTFKLAAATAAAALLSLSVPALASPTPFKVSQQQSNVHGTNGSVNITITSPAGSIGTSAGSFALTSDAAKGPVIGDFIAWCLDIGHWLNLPSTYSVTTSPFNPDGSITAVVATLTQLVNTAYKGVLGNATDSAAFQLALWEIVNEGSGDYDVNDGDFYASDYGSLDSSAVRDRANWFLDHLDATPTGNYKLTFLQYESTLAGAPLPGQPSQNLVTISEVPLPAAGLLLIGALGGLGMFARRRKAAA